MVNNPDAESYSAIAPLWKLFHLYRLSSNTVPLVTMFQVNFSEQSIHELNQLDTRSQMILVEIISSLTQEQLDHPNDDLGCFYRSGKRFYRVRAGEFRIYFEQQSETLYAHYILHRNTFIDFVFRSKLPVTEEFLIEQHDSFWKYLDSLRHRAESSD